MPKASNIDMTTLTALYRYAGLSADALGQTFGVTGRTVSRLLRKARVPRNKANNAGKRNSHWAGGMYVDGDGYVQVRFDGHARADSHGYVNRSIISWETFNGEPFPDGMEPHHKNLVRDDDRPANIEPKTHVGHAELHAQLAREAKACSR